MNSIVTRYGSIPYNELKICKIPNEPFTQLPDYMSKYYIPEIDKNSSEIHLQLNNHDLVLLDDRTNISLFDVNKIIVKGSQHKIKLPKNLDPKLAYLVGYLQGDGGFKDIRRAYLKTGRYEHKIIVADEFLIQIERIKNLFYDLFGLETTIRTERKKKGENMYYINPTCKAVYRFFVVFFRFNMGPKKNLKIPDLILDSNEELFKWYLRGFMDADGDVRAIERVNDDYSKLPSPRIKIRLAEKSILVELKNSINKYFDISMTGPYTDGARDWYAQCALKGMLRSNEQMLFTHPIKRWRLEKYIYLKDQVRKS
tara:strand:+ start:3186 stop:4121 length:936 start_codon:yes stop_codon:yes gene_type:complete